jgi:hypothetical protein
VGQDCIQAACFCHTDPADPGYIFDISYRQVQQVFPVYKLGLYDTQRSGKRLYP